jgi:dihydroorotase
VPIDSPLPSAGSRLLKGGRIIDPVTQLDCTGDVLVRDGVIVVISDTPLPPTADTIDCEGCIVSPGLIDLHVHFRDPDESGHHTETIASGSAAAAAGGFTAVCCMPNTTPAIDACSVVDAIKLSARVVGMTRVFPVACGTMNRRGETLSPILDLIASGAIAISDDGDGVADSDMMKRILSLVSEADSVFMQHCQDPTLTRGAAMNAGPLATRLGLGGWPREAEALMLRRDLMLNQTIGARYHAQHLSVAESVTALREAQAAGQPATGEASPHHLLLTEDACDHWNTTAKVNPPLRTEADIEALKVGIAEGTITVLATDHAPHPAQSKETDFASAAFGMVGLECALPLYREALIDGGVIDWPAMLAMMTSEPAAVTGLEQLGLGRLEVGGPADITIIDPAAEWTIDPTMFRSAGRNCPFAGRPARGRAIATMIGGDFTFRNTASAVEGSAVAR